MIEADRPLVGKARSEAKLHMLRAIISSLGGNRGRMLGAFVRFVFSDWWSGMSGALSIPFVFLGALNLWSQKDLFYILALLSLGVTLYRTWSRLQSRVIFNFDGRQILEGYSDNSFPLAKTYIANIKNESDRITC